MNKEKEQKKVCPMAKYKNLKDWKYCIKCSGEQC